MFLSVNLQDDANAGPFVIASAGRPITVSVTSLDNDRLNFFAIRLSRNLATKFRFKISYHIKCFEAQLFDNFNDTADRYVFA